MVILTKDKKMKHTQFLFGALLILVWSCSSDDATLESPAISSLNCAGVQITGSPVLNSAFSGSVAVPYAGGNGLAYESGSPIPSTGVVGLTARLTSGVLSTGEGTLQMVLSGTPTSSGTASFAFTFGNQSCSFSVVVSSGSTPVVTTGGWSVPTNITPLISEINAFKATLSSSQLAQLNYSYSVSHAKKWSNLPQSLYGQRVGLATSTFSNAQWSAFYSLLKVLTGSTSNEGNEEYAGIIDADNYLFSAGGGSGYGQGNYYLALLGEPSSTGLWCIQLGGHHGTIIQTYQNGKLTGGTPSFRSTEPYPTWVSTSSNKTLQPLVQEQTTMAAFLGSLSTSELNAARRSAAQNDIQLGPAKDAAFPTTKVGLRIGGLTATQQDLAMKIIKTYVDDLEDLAAASVLAKYQAELPDTYVSFVGTNAMNTKGDYLLLDGPSVWIEWSMQGGIVIRNGVHPHSVWRDRKSDYGSN